MLLDRAVARWNASLAAPYASWTERLRGLFHTRWKYLLLSVPLLAPCYWQPRLQAGDLSSHIYNAWLAQLVETGRAQGLAVVPQTTDILFDLMVGGLLRLFGSEVAQRVSVSLAVLIFIWGAFAFASAVARRKTWHLLPCIAMLSYGWVFHMGFFNFYISLGLCFWALAVCWKPGPRRLAVGGAILAVAYLAHALPVVWCVCLLGYLTAARNASPRVRGLITIGALLLMAVARIVAGALLGGRWYRAQLASLTGADQVWVFDPKYYAVLIGLLMVWGTMFLRLIHQWGSRHVFSSVPFQFFVMSAGGSLILPSTVFIPGCLIALTYISERMSLGIAICVCALLASVRPRPFERYALAALVVAFFSFLYVDERALNKFEDRMEGAVAAIQPSQRVVSLVDDPDLRANALTHMIDRVCVGRCFSFANFEPSTHQYRVRTLKSNPFVVATYADSWELQTGSYLVKPEDQPIYAVDLDHSGKIVIRGLIAGALCGSTFWKILPAWFPAS